jgi:hypothetical protein
LNWPVGTDSDEKEINVQHTLLCNFVNFAIKVIRLVRNCQKEKTQKKSFWENMYCLHKRATAEVFLLHSS